MNINVKEKLPLLFLLAISLSWGFYYQGEHWFNNYGAANFEWLFLLDALLVLPLLCFVCIKDKKQAAVKAAILCGLAVLVGSYIIPAQSKLIWNYLESGRYLLLALILMFELVAVLTVYLAISTALRQKSEPELAISRPIHRLLGKGVTAGLLEFETRIWTYALFAKHISPAQFHGEQHFSYHLKDDAKTNALGFILLIALEIPLVHLLLHFAWSPLAANIVSGLTLLSLIFFIAEYRAMARRPLSVDKKNLYIRFGIYNTRVVALDNIAGIALHHGYIARASDNKRYNFAGHPNVAIELRQSDNTIKHLYLGVDQPQAFIDCIQSRLQTSAMKLSGNLNY